ncbi:hypothetical protein H8959_021655 [Pygathrix nigripes]
MAAPCGNSPREQPCCFLNKASEDAERAKPPRTEQRSLGSLVLCSRTGSRRVCQYGCDSGSHYAVMGVLGPDNPAGSQRRDVCGEGDLRGSEESVMGGYGLNDGDIHVFSDVMDMGEFSRISFDIAWDTPYKIISLSWEPPLPLG